MLALALRINTICARVVQHHGAFYANDACNEPTASKSSLSTMPPSPCPSYACTGSVSISRELACACSLIASY